MHRVLQSLRLGPHHVDVVEYADDEGGGLAVVIIDGMVVTDPLPTAPGTDELLGVYAGWKATRTGPPGVPPPKRPSPPRDSGTPARPADAQR